MLNPAQIIQDTIMSCKLQLRETEERNRVHLKVEGAKFAVFNNNQLKVTYIADNGSTLRISAEGFDDMGAIEFRKVEIKWKA